MSLHPGHALFVIYQQHPRDLLALHQQQQLAKLADNRDTYGHLHDRLALAVQAYLHRLTAFAALAPRERPTPATEPGESSALSLANGGASFSPLHTP